MQGHLRKASSVEGGCDLDSYGLEVIARVLTRRRQWSS